MTMNRCFLLCQCLVTVVVAQTVIRLEGDLASRGARRLVGGLLDGAAVRRVGISPGIGGAIDSIVAGGGGRPWSRGIGGRGRRRRARICYRRGEVPSFDRRGDIEWCSSSYNYCNEPGAVCRLGRFGRGRFGTCCVSRRRCQDGSQGIGSCTRIGDCFQYGRDYQCELSGRGYGRCCRGCQDGSQARGSCTSMRDCFQYGRDYQCELSGTGYGRCCRGCQDGSQALGYCTSIRDCLQYGRDYQCERSGGGYGRCCRGCQDGSQAAGSCTRTRDCLQYGRDYQCERSGGGYGRCCHTRFPDIHCPDGSPAAQWCHYGRDSDCFGGHHYRCIRTTYLGSLRGICCLERRRHKK